MFVPGTILYASIFEILYLFLSLRVSALRRRYRQGTGSGQYTDLNLAIRVHANANEYGPLTLLLLMFFELIQQATWAVHLIGCLFLLARGLHYIGLRNHGGASKGRFYGILLNYLIILTLSGFNLLYLLLAQLI